ncbi:DUF2799 domain-containing protein [Wenzhouxiangella sp. AB-CW3]|uniref:DUF2799 domain-containing protein n=1 Tax=Wenzhouxiangella sp. AB-CW3 TaxID=2771012 RepID=UPI00168B350E|nr:DUF2799 domain-containing protein [Wenzhouxiangella sp. AB-CW3]QOC23859.1 DUF2799 domain-containing protein [Wenzhouxiangella sp. AB-CW3]
MSPEECAVADWERIGEMDARAGQGMSYFARRADDCAEAGYPADREAWTHGWDTGIVWFCTRNNGFRQGINGQRYDSICPGELEPEFLDGYDTGQAVYQARSRVDRSVDEIRRAEDQLAQLREERPRDREAIAETRERLAVLRDRLRDQELELARLEGLAQGQGFPLSL